jgi:virginiamycin B lyase
MLPLLAGLTLAWAAPSGAAAAAGNPFTNFSIPKELGYPRQITVGPDRALWFRHARRARPRHIGRLSTSGKYRAFPLPKGTAESHWLLALVRGSDGALWYPYGGYFGRMTVDGSVTRHPLPANVYTHPRAVTRGPDRALWFGATVVDYYDPYHPSATSSHSAIGRITVDGQVTQYPLPPRLAGAEVTSMTTGPDGALWFTSAARGALWYTKPGLIGRISTAGEVREFELPGFWNPTCARRNTCLPTSITSGGDGHLWFVPSLGNFGTIGNKIGRMSVNGRLQVFRDRCAARFSDTAVGPDGAMWFTAGDDDGTSYVGRITSRGTVKRWALPISANGRNTRSGFARSSSPGHIVGGPDNALWFTTTVFTIGRVAARIAHMPSTVSPPGGPRGCKRRGG